MLQSFTKRIRKKLRTLINRLTGKPAKTGGEFRRRIRQRHSTFWQSPDAEIIRNTAMSASDPIEKWKDVENWQRKLSNKYNAREFAAMHGCRVPELYWKGKNASQIDFGKLPGQYVVRPTIGHSCDLVFLMDNGFNLMDKRTYSPGDIKKKLAAALGQNPDLAFLIEEFVRTEEGAYKIPDDFKFYMFNGEVACIQVINRLKPRKGFTHFYDKDWKPLGNLTSIYPEAACQPPPKCLDEMAAYARQLSRSYEIFARIDFYATDKGAVFGEFTPTPGVGTGFAPSAETLFTSYWDTYCPGRI